MAGEEITKFAVNDTLGKSDFKPLNKIVEDCTDIKVQTVTFSFSNKDEPTGTTKTVTIDEIDVSKSIIVPISWLRLTATTSLAFGFNSGTSIYCTRNGTNYEAFDFTVQVITFGANVVKEWLSNGFWMERID